MGNTMMKQTGKVFIDSGEEICCSQAVSGSTNKTGSKLFFHLIIIALCEMTLALISVASGSAHPSSKVSSFSITFYDTLRLLITFTTALHPMCSLSVLCCLDSLK